MKSKFCFDEKCLDLARYFYPEETDDNLRPLAQELQDAVESFAPVEAGARKLFNRVHGINEGAWDRQTEERKQHFRDAFRKDQADSVNTGTFDYMIAYPKPLIPSDVAERLQLRRNDPR